jgi:hypothetical protein
MSAKTIASLVACIACISAAEAPSNYQTFHGIPVDSNSTDLTRFEIALARCIPEASSWPRGTPDPRSLYYNAALRNCLYRQGFIDRGSYAYPANNLFVPPAF